MTSLDEKFFDFCDISSSYKIGGVNDVYSEEQIEDFNSQIQINLTADQKKELINTKIGQANTINEELRKMEKEFHFLDFSDLFYQQILFLKHKIFFSFPMI